MSGFGDHQTIDDIFPKRIHCTHRHGLRCLAHRHQEDRTIAWVFLQKSPYHGTSFNPIQCRLKDLQQLVTRLLHFL